MTREEFLKAVGEEKIRSSAFDLDGDGDECYVLSGNDKDWSVFYSERGSETQKRYFTSESTALNHLLAVLRNDPSTKLQG